MLRMMTLVAPSVGDLALGFEAGPFGDRQHGDHRADAEDQAEDRQQHAQLVQREVAHGQQDGGVEAMHGGTFLERGR